MGDLPEDPVILLSYVNTELRDHDRNLDAFCARHDVSRKVIEDRLAALDYHYDSRLNRFC